MSTTTAHGRAEIQPILPGFHPDPSICRAGEDYYIATSSFEYLPGVPIFHSRDLLRWTQIGNALERFGNATPRGSSGIYAPTLRHHDGRFWLVTTNVNEYMQGHLLTWATDPRGPWSEPVHITGAVGIDPDLSWDDAGACRLTWSAGAGETRIVQARLDLGTGTLLSEPRELEVDSGAHAEAPHLIRHGDWWYLLLAEGGTSHGHSVTVARSRSIDGPFESNPANPILTHRSTALPVQNTGHADFVETVDGGWAAVYLGVRPRGRSPKWHVNGRETFLAGVDWVDDWPVIDEERYDVPTRTEGVSDHFAAADLAPWWISPGIRPADIASVGPRGVVVAAPDGHVDARPLLAVRAAHAVWTAAATVAGDSARLTVRLDDDHWAGVELDEGAIVARVRIGPADQALASAAWAGGATLVIRAAQPAVGPMGATAPDLLELGFDDGDGFRILASVDGRYLSTEVAGGFTGRVVGIEPATGRTSTSPVSAFSYIPQQAGDGR